MNTKNIVWRGFLDGVGAFVYIAVVSWSMFNASRWFGNGEESFLIPIFMLLLFVVSATITGFLVLGKPIMLYLDGEKKTAYSLLFVTIVWLVIFL